MTEVDRLKVIYEVNDAQYRAGMARMERQTEATGRAIVNQANRSERAFRSLGSGNIQNVAFQVGDFATQVGAGTSASIALGQQLPQLLGGFGALGAVLGAVVAVAVPLGAAFLGMGKDTQTLKERMDSLNGAMRDYQEAIDNATVSTAEMVEKYGTATGAAREFLAALVEITQVEALKSLDAQITSLATRFGDLASVSSEAIRGLQGPGAYADQIDQFSELRSTLDLTTQEAFGLLDAIVALGDASGPDEQARAARDLQQAMIDVLGPVKDMTESQREYYKELVLSGDKAAEMVGDVEDLSDRTFEAAVAAGDFRDAIASIDFSNPIGAAEDLRSIMGGMVGQAQSLVSFLGAAAQAANKQLRDAVATNNELDPLGAFNGNGRAFGDSVQIGFGGNLQAPVIPDLPTTPSGGGRRSGGGGGRSSGGSGREEAPFFGDLERDLEQLQRQIDLVGKSSEEVATLRAKWELLDEAKRRGLAVNDELNAKIDAQSASVGRLTAELERGEIAQEQFETAVDGIADSMSQALIAGESLREGLAQVFAGIASDLLNSGIRQAIGGMFGGGGFNIGSLFGGLPSFDGGGFTGYGSRSGGIDGRGGYPAILHPNETVVDHTKGQSTGGTVNINVNVSGARGNAEIEQMVASGVQQGLGGYDKALPGRVQEINRNPRKR